MDEKGENGRIGGVEGEKMHYVMVRGGPFPASPPPKFNQGENSAKKNVAKWEKSGLNPVIGRTN